jgi:hypothetical protein
LSFFETNIAPYPLLASFSPLVTPSPRLIFVICMLTSGEVAVRLTPDEVETGLTLDEVEVRLR